MSSEGCGHRFARMTALRMFAYASCTGAAARRIARRAVGWLLVGAVFATLAACEGDSLTPQGSGTPTSAGTTDVKPSVSLQPSATSIKSGQAITLTWNASDAQTCTASGGWSGTQPTSGSLSTPQLSSTTSYTLTCTGSGGSTTQSRQVTVTPYAAPSITLSASPTTVSSSGTSTLQWSALNATQCVATGGWHGDIAVSGTWATGQLSNDTEFEITCTGPGGSSSQSTTVTVTSVAPEVTLQSNPSTVQAGGTSTLSWTSQNAASCTASGNWAGSRSVSGSQSTGAVKANSTYTLTCIGIGGQASQSTTVTVASAAPSIALSAAPSTVSKGGLATLSWSATHATACTASGAWSGSRPTSGSQSTGTLDANATYTLTCSGAGGSASQSATVSVKSPTPTVTLSVGPSAVANGASATLTWTSANATACSASGGWSGAKATSGSQSTGPLSATASYTLTCTGPGGSAAQSASVSVKTTPPTVQLSAAPSSVASGS